MISLGAPFIEIAVPERRSGVYLLVSLNEVIYVGQSVDIDGRISIHRSNRGMEFDRVFILLLPEAELAAHEGALIRAFNPRFNAMAPHDHGDDAAILERLGIPIDPDQSFEIRRQAHFTGSIRKTRKRSARQSREWRRRIAAEDAALDAEIALIEGKAS